MDCYYKNLVQLTPKDHTRCVCCLATTDVQLIFIKTCTHSSIIELLCGKVLQGGEMVCLVCHSLLKKLHSFKLYVEENINLCQQEPSNSNKLINLQITCIDIYNTPNDVRDIEESIQHSPHDEVVKHENIVTVKRDTIDCLQEYLNDKSIIKSDTETDIPIVDVKQESSFDAETDLIDEMKIENNLKHSKHKKGKNRKVKRSQKVVEDDKSYEMLCEGLDSSGYQPTTCNNLRYSCEHCGRMFRWRCVLRRHVRAAHVDERSHCQHCAKVFRNGEALRRHVESVHRKKGVTDTPPQECPICHKIFKMKKTLHVHLKRIHKPDTGKEEERYCVECNKLFKSKLYYELHLKTTLKHSTNKYECDECSKQFTLKSNLVSHILRLHLQRKRHACSVCGKLFHKDYLRRVHEQHNHFGVPRARNHVCSLCGKTFTCRSTHTQRAVTTEYKSACAIACAMRANAGNDKLAGEDDICSLVFASAEKAYGGAQRRETVPVRAVSQQVQPEFHPQEPSQVQT